MVLNRKALEIPSALEMLRILRDRKNWNSRSPYQRWCFFYGFGRIATALIKMPMFHDDLTLSYFAFIPVFYVFFHISLVVYTMMYYVRIGDPMEAFPCTSLLGPIFAVN